MPDIYKRFNARITPKQQKYIKDKAAKENKARMKSGEKFISEAQIHRDLIDKGIISDNKKDDGSK